MAVQAVGDIHLPATSIRAGDRLSVQLTITNTGSRAGSEVVQVYVAPPAETPLFRPRRELKGLVKVHLEPGEQREIAVELDWRSFAYWTPADGAAEFYDRVRLTPFASTVPERVPPRGWTVVAGQYGVDVARSVTDVVAELSLRIDSSIGGGR